MDEVRIDALTLGDASIVAELYNEIFRPAREAPYFERRLAGRPDPVLMTAVVRCEPVGFFAGFELEPGVLCEWLYGVLPGYRQGGLGGQLVDAAHAWARDRGYEAARLECTNQERAMVRLAVGRGYDVVGLRWDPQMDVNRVVMERPLNGWREGDERG